MPLFYLSIAANLLSVRCLRSTLFAQPVHQQHLYQEESTMSRTRVRKPTLIALSLLLVLACLSFAPQPAVPASGGNAIALKAPSFVSAVSAQEATPSAVMGFPQDEAGISAYFKSATPITLADVRSVFRVIEAETTDYIIGSVPVANYPELYDVHLFVHRDGWFVAYYLAADPVSKIADAKNYTGQAIGTLLEKTLSIAAISGGVPFSTATFYDFRYPNATHFILIGEAYDSGDNSFTIQLPVSYAYYERSWALYSIGGSAYFRLDGADQTATAGSNPYYGVLTAAQLLPGSVHTINVDDYGFLAVVYRVQ
jgi:hypothetical protein